MKQERIFGYARVSSTTQNLDRQIISLRQYVPEENIIVDKKSGKDLERDGYQALKGPLGLRSGDILYITSLDRLSRSRKDILEEIQWFEQQNVVLKVIELPTTMQEFPEGQEWIRTMINRIIIEVLSSIAEQERMTIRKRQREGINVAKSQGKHLGRPRVEKPENWDEITENWRKGLISAKKAIVELNISKTTFYRLLKEEER